MLQQFLALTIVLYFVIRLFVQKSKDKISFSEFIFWFIFWMFVSSSVVFIKKIDSLAVYFGFSASGINILSYLALAILFYLFFRIRIRLAEMERNISIINKELTIKNYKKII